VKKIPQSNVKEDFKAVFQISGKTSKVSPLAIPDELDSSPGV